MYVYSFPVSTISSQKGPSICLLLVSLLGTELFQNLFVCSSFTNEYMINLLLLFCSVAYVMCAIESDLMGNPTGSVVVGGDQMMRVL